jgi:uncharacterized protein YjgD (DUF1641 family)
MDKTDADTELREIHRKLDLLVSDMEAQRRKQRELEELKNDLILIGRDAFQTAVLELEEVAPYFETKDLAHLLKRLLRNARNLVGLVDMIENVADFLEDAKPLSKHAFSEVLETLDSLDRKGYFDFIREAAEIVDTIVTSFSVEDVRLLRENITEIILTLKNLTQPEMLATVNNAVGFYRKMGVPIKQDVSYSDLLRQLRDPEVKRGLFFMLEFAKSIPRQNGSNSPAEN